MKGMLELKEDDRFYFDFEAGDRVVRFIQRFCRHFEGRRAGERFTLEPIQQRIIRDIFGWKWRDTGLRRFTDVYWEGAVGCGKSPILAGIGLYGLTSDGERGAQVFSLASTYKQARIVFDCAKSFCDTDRELDRRLDRVEREIRHKPTRSKWELVSGTGPGAGCRPTMILADEVHEWKGAGGYNALRDRMFKRRQPLLIAATNAGESQSSFCWGLRELAIAALEGKGDPTLYPIIWAADEDAKTDDPAAARAANPLLDVTISSAKVAQLAVEAMKSDEEEARFRRLYLGVWPKKSGGKLIDLAKWDAASADRLEIPSDAILYAGIDLSQSDDLSAAVYVYCTPGKMIIDAKFWLPEVTARRYEAQAGTQYEKWAAAGAIRLVDSPTINDKVRAEIAADVLARHARHPIKAVCYDRWKADVTVAKLEAAGLICVPIPQGYSVSPGVFELDRRLKEDAIAVTSNPVLRFCAENAETKADDRGNLWIIKPDAAGTYKGVRWRKVDGITALVTALVEARKAQFPNARKMFRGTVTVA